MPKIPRLRICYLVFTLFTIIKILQQRFGCNIFMCDYSITLSSMKIHPGLPTAGCHAGMLCSTSALIFT